LIVYSSERRNDRGYSRKVHGDPHIFGNQLHQARGTVNGDSFRLVSLAIIVIRVPLAGPLRVHVDQAFCSVLFCKFYIRWRPIKASDELVGEL
jgi:hypothetical protein